MSFTFTGGGRRPVIDVNSENLIFIWNLPRWIDISEIKRSLQPKYGRIKFVETFEAWREGRRLGQIILDFATSSSLSEFARGLSNRDEFNYDGVEFMRFDPKIGQVPFFNFVRQQTNIDLLACGGVPPSFEYKRKGPVFGGREQNNPNNIPLGPRGKGRQIQGREKGEEGYTEGGKEGGTPSANNTEEGANRSDGRTDSSITQYREKSRSREDSAAEDTPSANNTEEGANRSDGRTDSSFTQYREKSRSREDSAAEDRDGHGGTGVKNTLKITQLDFAFDIAKILEALQSVGEVVHFERLGKTSAAFTFDDAAEAANASVLVVGDLVAPNAYFQLMTQEEAYQ